MKKRLVFSLATLVLSSSILPGISGAVAYADDIKSVQSGTSEVVEQNYMVSVIESYVHVTNGKIELKNVPYSIYEKYQLDQLQKHFNNLNEEAEMGNIRINNDLTIETIGSSSRTVHGTWTYHWWGYDQYFNNQRAIKFANEASTVAGGAGIATGIGLWFPPVGALFGVTSGYWTLVSARVTANNKGRGVYVGVTWAAIFNIEPL